MLFAKFETWQCHSIIPCKEMSIACYLLVTCARENRIHICIDF